MTQGGWLSIDESYRALVVRNRVDEQLLAVEQQHDRVLGFCARVRETGGLSSLTQADISKGATDVDLFLLCLRRLGRVRELAGRSALPGAGGLRLPFRVFDRATAAVQTMRNAMEHVDGTAVKGSGGFGVSGDRVSISYAGTTVDTLTLFAAARRLHAAVRTVVDPVAVLDPHGQDPIVPMLAAPTPTPSAPA